MPIENQEEALRRGIAHHQAGRFQEAELVYREVLASDQNCAPAWQLLGTLASQLGQAEAGAQMIERAVQLGMKTPETFNVLGECYRLLGRIQDAGTAFQTALQLNPNFIESKCNIAALLLDTGRPGEAIPILEDVLNQRPDSPHGRFHYGVALQNVGNTEAAIRQWEVTLQLAPNDPLVMKHLGIAYHTLQRFDDAIRMFENLVRAHPNLVDGYECYSRALMDAGRHDEALAAATRATELGPARPESFNALALVHMQSQRLPEAIDALTTAISLNPNYFDAVGNLGSVHSRMKNYSEAEKWLERAVDLNPSDFIVNNVLHSVYYLQGKAEKSLEIIERGLQVQPQNPDLHFNRAGLLLALGRLAEGFEEYEWRWRAGGFEYLSARQFNKPQWDGSNPAGKTILVHSEQGYGDVIQGARYLPMLLEIGAKVVVVIPQEVCSLIRSIPGLERVGHHIELVDLNFDMHIPVLGFPRAFRTTLETIPNKVPYLFPDPALVEKWKPVIEASARGMKIGLVWGGSATPYPGRSTTLRELSLLKDVSGVTWYSLQVDGHRQQLSQAPAEMGIVDIGRDLGDFSDTAAVMSQMDLILTIDTASAHLAGALGLKTWMMVPFAPDWRWMLKGESSPWYPTMRLFRQSRLDEWGPVIARVNEELKELVNSRAREQPDQ